jgi:hypothetical protein
VLAIVAYPDSAFNLKKDPVLDTNPFPDLNNLISYDMF